MSERIKWIHNRSAICPFYIKETSTQIVCEGPVDDSTMHIIFKTQKECSIYKVKNCCSFDSYKNKRCLIAKLLFEKHEADQPK